ncbi:MAG: thiosulfate oxidation carrier protein SoxY [Acidobacteriota bacterium]|nr:thiosulfate oxidation carrier protein SoxY [Acidobacteriota bacterium]
MQESSVPPRRFPGPRTWLPALGILCVLVTPPAPPPAAAEAVVSPSIAGILQHLTGVGAYTPSDAIALVVPDRADRGERVPVTVHVRDRAVDALFVFVESAAEPLALHLWLTDGVTPRIVTRVRLCRTGRVVAVAQTAEGLIGTARTVYLGARARCAPAAEVVDGGGTLQVRTRVRSRRGRVRLRTRVAPPPPPGTRLASLSLHHGDEAIFQMQAGASLAATAPLELSFTTAPSAYLHLRWTDNHQRSGEHSLHLP